MASAAGMSSRKSSEFQVESPGYSTVTGYGGSYLQFRSPGQAEKPVAVGASGIAAEGDRKQFQRAFLLLKSEAIHAPEDLIFAERCREDCVRRWNRIRGPERSETGLAVDIQVEIRIVAL